MIHRNVHFVLSGILAIALYACADPTGAPTGPFDIVFTRAPIDGSRPSELWLMRADGTNQKQLTSNRAALSPVWSPDGSEIAFESMGTERDVINVETGATRKILGGYGLVRWSPDGTRIVFGAFPSLYSAAAEIFTVNPDGTNRQQLTFDQQLSKSAVDWSPDGSQLAVTGTSWNAGEPYVGLYIFRADGTGMTRITDTIPEGNDITLAWSPDGSRIAFVGDGGYIGASTLRYRSSIHTVRPDGSMLTQLSHDGYHDASPSWSPDGKQIVFTSDRDGHLQIYVMNADGTSQVRLVESPTNDSQPAWRRR